MWTLPILNTYTLNFYLQHCIYHTTTAILYQFPSIICVLDKITLNFTIKFFKIIIKSYVTLT